MADNIYYPNLGEIYARAAQVKNAMYEQQMAPIRMQNELVSNRINQLKAREYEKELAKKGLVNKVYEQYSKPSRPAETATGNAFAASMPRSVETAPAQPGGFDARGAAQAMYGIDPQEAMALEDRATATEDKEFQSKMGFYTPMIKSFIEAGDNEGLKNLIANVKKDPVLSKRLPPEFDMNITPQGEIETVTQVQPGTVDPSTGGPLLDPYTKQPIQPGTYKFKVKGGKLISVEPYQKAMGGRQIEKTVDLGDKIEYIYADGTREMKPKGMAPGANIQDRRLQLMEEKEARKEETAAKKENLNLKGAMAKADILIGKVDEALSKTGFWTTGLTGDLRSTMVGRVTGGGAFDLEKTIDTIKSIIGFGELQAIRDASKTGGALGQIAVRELELLQSTIAGLDKGQSEAQLRRNLEQVKTHYQNIKAALAKIAEAKLQPTAQPQTKAPMGKRPPLSAFEKR